MFRSLILLTLIPNSAAADWSPRPSMFTYDATFDLCIFDPSQPDLARRCEQALSDAYVLKRAVAWATYKCHPESLKTCAGPFADEGLPAIAARIAVDVGCDATDVLNLPEGRRLPENHCITIASDIMIDEGVVPLFSDITCGIEHVECTELARLNAAFWTAQVTLIAPDDDVIKDLQIRNVDDCETQANARSEWAANLDTLDCIADRSALLWADLAMHFPKEN